MDPNHNAFDDSPLPPTLPSKAAASSEVAPTFDDPIAVVTGDGPYPIEAYQFVQDGLRHTVDRILRHTRSLQNTTEHVGSSAFDMSFGANLGNNAGAAFEIAAELPFADPDSRHITGQQLCIGLREYAIQRYGMLAPVVLRHWNVLRTEDFGRIVYRLIDLGLMSRTPDDSQSDFAGVYEFDEVFGAAQLAARIGRN